MPAPRWAIGGGRTVSAFGCSPLRYQCLHRGPAAGLQPGHRSTRTHPSQVPRPEACRDAQHRREPASARLLGYRDDPVSYTHLRAHETKANLVCRLLLEKKNKINKKNLLRQEIRK